MSHSKTPIDPPTAPLTILTLSPSTQNAFFPTLLALCAFNKQISKLQPSQVHSQEPDASNDRELLPCDTFTLIAGTGFAGGCLALFLGRFRLSCMGALDEWHDLAKTGPQIILRNFYFPIRQFLAWTMGTKFKRTSQMSLNEKERVYTFMEVKMFREADEQTRCRHVVVVGNAEKGFEKGRKKILKTTKKNKEKSAGRAIHRTYDVADEGATDPRTTKIFFDVLGDLSEAEPSANSKGAMEASLGEKSQEGAYRTVALALEEVWALYGKNVRIAAIVDVGDRFEEDEEGADVREVARCFFPPVERHAAAALVGGGGAGGEEHEVKDGVGAGAGTKMAPGAAGEDADSETTKVDGGQEDSVQKDVEAKLREAYGEDAPPFYRLKARTRLTSHGANGFF
ncbi:MAG: hypothetical protein LQ350_005232 [Teloschistes chrysophthalmus]|nr:MAG: hypothetical protein LQ350_005232 [Niorma chrysophthalma]